MHIRAAQPVQVCACSCLSGVCVCACHWRSVGYLLYLLGLQEVTGFAEVGSEGLWLQLRLDGRAMLGVHLLLGGYLETREAIRGRLGAESTLSEDVTWSWLLVGTRQTDLFRQLQFKALKGVCIPCPCLRFKNNLTRPLGKQPALVLVL